jgi:hypothetical protein
VIGLIWDFPEPVINKRIIVVAVGVVAFILAAILFVRNWKLYGQRVLIFSWGFQFQSPRCQDKFFWDRVVEVHHQATRIGRIVSNNITLTMDDGRRVLFSEFLTEVQRLVDIVLSETERRMLPAALESIRVGEYAKFGDLRVTADSLIFRDRVLTWDAVKGVEVAHGHIDIRQNHDGALWYSTAVKKMPNYHVFLSVSAEMMSRLGEKELQ